jgi:ParB family chromosome partitioning protein
MTNKQKRGLGKGIEGLLANKDTTIDNQNIDNSMAGKPLMVKVELIQPNPDQPRQYFNTKEMDNLANSIIEHGILEPLIVRNIENGFELIAGHRRLIAAKNAGLKEIPVIIKELSNKPSERLELALIENIIREDLNPIEEAEAFKRLEKEFEYTILQIAKITGKERPTIVNAIRLLDLTDDIKDDIRYKRLTPGHGKAILSITNKEQWQEARSQIITKNYTVKQTEALAKRINRSKSLKPDKNEGEKAYYESLEKSFSDSLGGFKVRIFYKGRTKKIEILYKSNKDMEYLMEKFNIPNQ